MVRLHSLAQPCIPSYHVGLALFVPFTFTADLYPGVASCAYWVYGQRLGGRVCMDDLGDWVGA
jgi:hypothetical protein